MPVPLELVVWWPQSCILCATKSSESGCPWEGQTGVQHIAELPSPPLPFPALPVVLALSPCYPALAEPCLHTQETARFPWVQKAQSALVPGWQWSRKQIKYYLLHPLHRPKEVLLSFLMLTQALVRLLRPPAHHTSYCML